LIIDYCLLIILVEIVTAAIGFLVAGVIGAGQAMTGWRRRNGEG